MSTKPTTPIMPRGPPPAETTEQHEHHHRHHDLGITATSA
jgi:hypothetical protein